MTEDIRDPKDEEQEESTEEVKDTISPEEEDDTSEETTSEDLLKDMEYEDDTIKPKPVNADEPELDLDKLNEPENKEFDKDSVIPVLISGTNTEVRDKIVEIGQQLSPQQIEEAAKRANSRISLLYRSDENYSPEWERSQESLKTTGDNELLSAYKKDDIRLVDTSPIHRKDLGGKLVVGKEARMLIKAKGKNIRNVFLYNSGISVTLESPTLAQLNTFYNAVSSDVEEYGKEFGVHFYMFNSFVIKKHVIELFISLVTDASVKNWNKSQNLIKAISMHDYKVILWAIGQLMYKEGFPFKYVCLNSKCNYSEEVKIDLKKLRYNNYSMLSEEHLKFINNPEKKNHKELEKYRSTLITNKKIKLHDAWMAVTKIPTLYEYLDYAAIYNAALTKSIHVEDVDAVRQYLMFNFYKVYTPWIKEIQYINEDDTISFHIALPDDISVALDTELMEDSTFGEDINNFILESAVSHICYPVFPCPSCGHVPSNAHNGFIAFDVEQNFFTQSAMKLSRLF